MFASNASSVASSEESRGLLKGNVWKQSQKEKKHAGSADEDEYEGIIQVVSRFYTNASNFILWFLAELSENADIHPAFVWARGIVVALQLLSFVFYPAIQFQWNSSLVDVVERVCLSVSKFPSSAYWRFGEWIFASSLFLIIAFLLVICALVVVHLRWTWSVRWLRYILLLIPNVLLFPAVAAWSKLFFGCFSRGASDNSENPFFPSIECWDGEHVGYSVLTVLMLVLWIWLSYLITIAFVDYRIPTDLNNPSLLACSSPRFLVVEMHFIVFLHALFAGIHDPSGRYPLSVLLIVVGLALIVIGVRYLPFYNDSLMALHVFQPMLMGWAGFSALIATILGTFEAGPAMLLYAVAPVLLVLSVVVVRARYSFIEALSSRELDAPYLFELRARSIMRQWMYLERVDSRDDIYLEETPERGARRKEANSKAEQALQAGVERFPESAFLHMYLGLFFICVLDNRMLAYGELQTVATKKPAFDVLFMLYKFRQVLDDENSTSQSSEVQSYLEFKARKELADAAVVEAAKHLVEFWSQLLRSVPDVDALAQQGHLARIAMARATTNYEKLLNINPNSIPVLRAFGTFALDVIGDVVKSALLFQRADDVERERQKNVSEVSQRSDFGTRLDHNLDIFDDRNAVFTVSVERTRLGEIESANASAKRVFGYSQNTDLIGKNIGIIVPSPMAEHHDRYLSEFLIRKTSYVLNVTRVMFGVHRAGHILPLHLYARWADTANGKMVGVVQPVTLTNDAHLMVNPKTMHVTYCTNNCYGVFGLLRRQLVAKEVRLHDVMPALLDRDDTDRMERNWELLSARVGIETEGRHLITGKPVRLHAWATTVDVHEEKIMFVRLTLLSDAGVDSDYSDDDGNEYSVSESEDEGAAAGAAGSMRGVASALRGAGGANASGSRPADPMDAHGSSPPSMRRRERRDDSTAVAAEAPTGAESKEGGDADKVEQDRRKRGGKADSLGDSESVGTSSAQGAGARQHNHKRLNRAIQNENKRTSKRLEQMAVYFIVIVVVAAGAALAMHFTDDVYIDFAVEQAYRTFRSATREFNVLETTTFARELSLLTKSSVNAFRRLPDTGSNVSTVGPYVLNRLQTALARLEFNTDTLDDLTTYLNPILERQNALYNKPTIRFVELQGNVSVVDTMCMRESILAFDGVNNFVVTAAQAALYNSTQFSDDTVLLPNSTKSVVPAELSQDLSNLEANIGLFGSFANGLRVVPEAINRDSQYMRDAIGIRSSEVLGINIGITVFTAFVITLVLLLLIRPIILRVEDSKGQVLSMFLDIPRSVRRAIRRRVYGVYLMMRTEDDESASNRVDEEDAAAAGKDDGPADEDATNPALAYLSASKRQQQHRQQAAAGDKGSGNEGGVGSDGEARKGDEQSYRKGVKDIDGWLAERRRAAAAAIAGEKKGPATPGTAPKGKRHGAGRAGAAPDAPVNLGSHTAAVRAATRGSTEMVPVGRSRVAGAGSSAGSASKEGAGAVDAGRGGATDHEGESFGKRYDTASSRRALRILFGKYLFFVLLVCAYFIVVDVGVAQRFDDMQSACATVDFSYRRQAAFIRAYSAAREFLFGNYAYLQANFPAHPALTIGDGFITAYRAFTDEATILHHSVVFGNSTLGLEVPPADPKQTALMFSNACTINNDEDAAQYTRPLSARFLSTCTTFLGGVLARGAHAGLLLIDDLLRGLLVPLIEGALAPSVGYPANALIPVGTAIYSTVLDAVNLTEQLVMDYISPILARSTIYYMLSAQTAMRNYDTFRIGFLIGFLFLLFALHLLVFHPIIRNLNMAARNTRAMMLVLPPDVAKSIPSVQRFIAENQRHD